MRPGNCINSSLKQSPGLCVRGVKQAPAGLTSSVAQQHNLDLVMRVATASQTAGFQGCWPLTHTYTQACTHLTVAPPNSRPAIHQQPLLLTSLRSSRKWHPIESMCGTGVRSRITNSTLSSPLARVNLGHNKGSTQQTAGQQLYTTLDAEGCCAL